MFDWVPGKVCRGEETEPHKVWQTLPDGFLVKQFYKHFSCASGELGGNFLDLWPDNEIAEMRKNGQNGGHPMNLFFFGGNGGGEWFGVYTDREVYFALVSISDPLEDISELGEWNSFRAAIESNAYI